jgi:hypothetical protein
MRCRGEVRRRRKGRQCTCRVMSERGARRWLEGGKISSGENLTMVGDVSRPGLGLCPEHAIRALEERKTPGRPIGSTATAGRVGSPTSSKRTRLSVPCPALACCKGLNTLSRGHRCRLPTCAGASCLRTNPRTIHPQDFFTPKRVSDSRLRCLLEFSSRSGTF